VHEKYRGDHIRSRVVHDASDLEGNMYQKMIYFHMCRLANEDNECIVSLRRLRERVKCNNKVFLKEFNSLKKSGLVVPVGKGTRGDEFGMCKFEDTIRYKVENYGLNSTLTELMNQVDENYGKK
jgi:hypothetical protein